MFTTTDNYDNGLFWRSKCFFPPFFLFFFFLNFTCFISLTITMRLTEGDILYLGDPTFHILVNPWTVYIGVLRVHRRKVHDHVPTAEDE